MFGAASTLPYMPSWRDALSSMWTTVPLVSKRQLTSM